MKNKGKKIKRRKEKELEGNRKKREERREKKEERRKKKEERIEKGLKLKLRKRISIIIMRIVIKKKPEKEET